LDGAAQPAEIANISEFISNFCGFSASAAYRGEISPKVPLSGHPEASRAFIFYTTNTPMRATFRSL
jgi:hypothetical protein